MVIGNLPLLRQGGVAMPAVLFAPQVHQVAWRVTLLPVAPAAPATLLQLFALMVKIGAVLYGSGYVLLAFLRVDFVQRSQWLTDRQLLDAVTVGQFTPGPVLTTATFIGYLLRGLPGAIVATAGIFLPAFRLVAITQPVLLRLRRSPWASAFLNGVNVTSLALMMAVAWQLGAQAIIDPLTAALAVGAAALLIYRKVNSVWVILAALIVGPIVR